MKAPTNKFNENSKGMRIMQHILFVALSFFILLKIFKTGSSPEKIDFVYTALFLATILPIVYIHLYWLLPKLRSKNSLLTYLFPLLVLSAFFVWLNVQLFDHWSAKLFPGFFFISYYSWWEITLFFVVFIVITALLKLSKSWFAVTELQRKLLESEKQKVQVELKALKAQINPHFFFNTLNSIYSMTLDKDERLPATVLQLSGLMRYFLYEAKEDLVLLQKEKEVLKDYIDLQKIRSNEKLQIEFNVDGKIENQKIAPLLLITFLENAFKHGAKGSTDNTFISIRLHAEENTINFRVENNKGVIDRVEKNDHKGLGLDNVKRRLELMYPGKHELTIQNTDDRFIVQLQLQL